MTTALVPCPEPPPPPPPPQAGFWTLLGQGLQSTARQVGAGFSAAYHAVDPDARRDLSRLPLLALTLLSPRQAPPRPLADDGHPPLIFVHGLGGHRGNFLPMRAWLAWSGRRRGYALGLPAGPSLAELGVLLARYIDQVIAVNGLPQDAQVDIIAHSMGGVVARLAVQELGCAARVRTLLTLGTPHGGTQAARFAGSPRCQELRPGSPVMQRLSHQLPWSGHPRLVCFWSRADPLMQPAETAQVEGAHNLELTGTSHTDYLLQRTTWRKIRQAIHSPPG